MHGDRREEFCHLSCGFLSQEDQNTLLTLGALGAPSAQGGPAMAFPVEAMGSRGQKGAGQKAWQQPLQSAAKLAWQLAPQGPPGRLAT